MLRRDALSADTIRPAWRVLLWPSLFTAFTLALLVSLGFWQLERLGAKERFAQRIEVSLAGQPQALPAEAEWPALKAKVTDYTKVAATGEFLHDKELFLYGVLNNGRDNLPGLFVITPLKLANGSIVFVNRGFITTDRKNPATRAEGQVKGPVTVTGILRTPQPRGMFTPDDDAKAKLFFTRDPAAFATTTELARTAPFSIDADATPQHGGWPKGGHTVVSFPNNHLQYAITWFMLSAGVLGFFLFWARRLLADERARATLVTGSRRP
jgi:surfeit locus 1 family protein